MPPEVSLSIVRACALTPLLGVAPALPDRKIPLNDPARDGAPRTATMSATRPQAQLNTFVVDAMVEFARLAAAAGGA